jgi:membrane protease YdiL (CAAX protease family)
LTKIVVASVVFGCILVIGAVFKDFITNGNISYLLQGIVVPTLTVVSFSWLYKVYEKRKFTEFSINGIGKNLTIGLLLGAVLYSFLILIMYLIGGYDAVISVKSFALIIPPLAMALSTSILEETLFRGFIFRIVEEKLGSYLALLISAIIFGLPHIVSDNSVGLILAITFGLLLAIYYMYSRNLWCVIAIHFVWNFFNEYIFGINVRHSHTKLITFKMEGTEWFAHGTFGPQAEILAGISILVVAIIFLTLCHKKGKIVKPYWTKQRTTTYLGKDENKTT